MLAVLWAVLLAACAAGPSSSPTPLPPATSAQEFGAAACSSLTAMSRGIGNPDTAADSVLSAALDDAIRAADQARVDEAAARMQAELSSARSFAQVAAGWPPGAAMAATLDRLMVGFAAFVEAKRAHAAEGLVAADAAAQKALADGGAITAWQALLGGVHGLPAEAARAIGACRFYEAGDPSPGASGTPVPRGS
jgi:hypothetical protein